MSKKTKKGKKLHQEALHQMSSNIGGEALHQMSSSIGGEALHQMSSGHGEVVHQMTFRRGKRFNAHMSAHSPPHMERS
jgi:hypothetical protein